MRSHLTDHQRKFIDSLRLDYRGNRDTKGYLHELLGVRLEEAAILRAIEARWDSLAAASRRPDDGRPQADARQLARATIRSLSSFGLPDGAAGHAADLAEAALREDPKRDFTLLATAVREVANPTRPRLAARLARVDEEVRALQMLLSQQSPKRAAARAAELPALIARQSRAAALADLPSPPGPMVGTGRSHHGIYRDVNAAIVDALSITGSLRHTEAVRILTRFEPYASLPPKEVALAAHDYLHLVEERWKELGREIHFEGAGEALALRKGPSTSTPERPARQTL